MLRISDEQWELIRKHFPEEHYPDDRPGRKRIPARKVLEAVLWILNTGAQWHMLPQSYPNYKTVHRRFQQWCENKVLRAALTELANTLREDGAIEESECYIDATFASAKGGGDEIGPTKDWMRTQQAEGLFTMKNMKGKKTAPQMPPRASRGAEFRIRGRYRYRHRHRHRKAIKTSSRRSFFIPTSGGPCAISSRVPFCW